MSEIFKIAQLNTKAKENRVFIYLLFFIWPFLSLFFAIIDNRQSWAKNIVWLFVAFYGYTMVLSTSGIDAQRYRDQFIKVAEEGRTIDEDIEYYKNDVNVVDFVKPILNIAISKITNNYKILFLVYGLIFGYFFSRSLWLLIERHKHRMLGLSILLLIVFALVNPIWNINGFRFWTAAQVFVYGCLIYFLEDKKRGLLITLMTFFVHFSFLIPIGILFIYYFIGNRLTIYFYFFVASLFITELNLEAVRSNLNFVPAIFEYKVNAYVREEYKEKRMINLQATNWYVKWFDRALKYSIYVFLITIYWRGQGYIKKNKKLFRLFCFSLLLFGFVNIISSIPTVGRFINVAISLSLALVILYLQFVEDKLMNLIVRISIPALLLFLIVSIRIGFYTMSLTTVLGNPLIAVFMKNDIALIDLIK